MGRVIGSWTFFFYSFFVFFFWLYRATCGILVPQSGIEPGPPVVEAQSPSCWTTREFPIVILS